MDVKEWAKVQEKLLKSQLRTVREILRAGDTPTRKPRRKGRSQFLNKFGHFLNNRLGVLNLTLRQFEIN